MSDLRAVAEGGLETELCLLDGFIHRIDEFVELVRFFLEPFSVRLVDRGVFRLCRACSQPGVEGWGATGR